MVTVLVTFSANQSAAPFNGAPIGQHRITIPLGTGDWVSNDRLRIGTTTYVVGTANGTITINSILGRS